MYFRSTLRSDTSERDKEMKKIEIAIKEDKMKCGGNDGGLV